MSNLNNIVLSCAYLAPIDYFKIIKASEQWKLEQYENYQKQSYRSRCHIYSANGFLPLYIPVLRDRGFSIPIKEVKIDNSKNWQIQHWRALVSAYNSSPFFDYYKDDFAPFYNNKYNFLFDYNIALLSLILELIGFPEGIELTQDYEIVTSEYDYRDKVHPKKEPPLVSENKKGKYHQVFAHKHGFISNLSIVDLLFNEGPQSYDYI
ncbi:MAG: WbqC family protein [Bacteroidales bacterium]